MTLEEVQPLVDRAKEAEEIRDTLTVLGRLQSRVPEYVRIKVESTSLDGSDLGCLIPSDLASEIFRIGLTKYVDQLHQKLAGMAP